MRLPTRGLSIMVALTAAAGIASAQPPGLSEAQAIALGHDLVLRNCGMCHATETTGTSPNAKAPPFRALGERLDMDQLGEGLATGILTQHPAMPEFRFAPHEVVAIVRYLRTVQEKQKT